MVTRAASTPTTVDLTCELPAQAAFMAEACATLLGSALAAEPPAALIDPLTALLIDIAATPGIQALPAVLWVDGPTRPWLTLYPALDMRRLGEPDDPNSVAFNAMGERFDRFTLAIWDERVRYGVGLMPLNTRGETLPEVFHAFAANLAEIDPLHGPRFGVSANPAVIILGAIAS